jgi:hypothetical protein
MLNSDGEYISPPPSWPMIQNGSLLLPQWALNSVYKNNLPQFVEMSNSEDGYGRVLQEHEFLEFCQYVESKGMASEVNKVE